MSLKFRPYIISSLLTFTIDVVFKQIRCFGIWEKNRWNIENSFLFFFFTRCKNWFISSKRNSGSYFSSLSQASCWHAPCRHSKGYVNIPTFLFGFVSILISISFLFSKHFYLASFLVTSKTHRLICVHRTTAFISSSTVHTETIQNVAFGVPTMCACLEETRLLYDRRLNASKCHEELTIVSR